MGITTRWKLYGRKQPIYKVNQNNLKSLVINITQFYRTSMKKASKFWRLNNIKMSVLPPFISECNGIPIKIPKGLS